MGELGQAVAKFVSIKGIFTFKLAIRMLSYNNTLTLQPQKTEITVISFDQLKYRFRAKLF